MAAPRRSPAIDLGDIGRGLGSLANDALLGPIGRVAKSAGKVNKKAGRVLDSATDFAMGVRGDRSFSKNLKGAAENAAYTVIGGKVFKGIGLAGRAAGRAVGVGGKTAKAGKYVAKGAKPVQGQATKKALTMTMAKKRQLAANKRTAATNAKYEKVYGYKAATKKTPVKKVAAKKKATVLR